MSKAVAVPDQAQLPDLASTPATELTAADITPPTLYLGHRLTGAVGDGRVNYGDLFVAFGPDDPEPTVVWEAGSSEPGVLFHPLHMTKSWTWSDGDTLLSWPFDATGEPPAEALQIQENSGKPVFLTFNYILLVPDYDPLMPVSLRLNSRSQRPAANAINIETLRSSAPMLSHAFRITTAVKPRGKSDYVVPVVRKVEATAEHQAQAAELFRLIAPGLQARAEAQSRATAAPSI